MMKYQNFKKMDPLSMYSHARRIILNFTSFQCLYFTHKALVVQTIVTFPSLKQKPVTLPLLSKQTTASLSLSNQKTMMISKLFLIVKAFNLQQTAEKLMKGLIILNNLSLFYKTNLAHSHNLFVLAKNVSYDFKSLCFAIAKKIEALGTSSNYRQLVAIRSRYHKTVNDTIDCTTIPYLSFQNCDFIDIFETMEKLYFKTVNFLNLSTNSNNIHLGINNLVFQFEKFNKN